ncbi:hypothetical protein [Sphingobium sp.]|uniref:hypothetical protein n=1 Tax=Sphingobium sp. TaxID=1912891 RepID=UPI0035C67B63
MIVLLIAASLTAQPEGLIRHGARIRQAPCQAVPSLCLAGDENEGRRLTMGAALPRDSKMNAYRFDARPCCVIGNMNCPKRANRQIFRLGEPIEQTLARSFGLN